MQRRRPARPRSGPRRIALAVLGAAAVATAIIGATTALATSPTTPAPPSAPEAAPISAPSNPLDPGTPGLADALPTPPGTTQRQSVGDDEAQANSQSGGATDLIAAANGDQAISADGRWVAFVSTASNLIPGTDQPPGRIYLRDRLNGETVAIPLTARQPWPAGWTAAEPAISADGAFVAFTVIVSSDPGVVGIAAPPATLPYVFAWSRETGAELVSRDDNGDPAPGYQPTISSDGRYVAYTRWAPQATPEPTPADTTAPTMSNLTASFNCVSQGGSVKIEANASDPTDGVAGVILSYTPVNGFTYNYGMFLNSATGRWEGYINPPSSWTMSNDGFIAYYVRGYDFHNNYSSPLFPSESQRVYFTYQGCIL